MTDRHPTVIATRNARALHILITVLTSFLFLIFVVVVVVVVVVVLSTGKKNFNLEDLE